jgi:hypothetical protein
MKNLLITVITLAIIACDNKNSNNNSANNSVAQQNIEAVHNIRKAFQTGDTSLINKSVNADFVDHKDVGDVKGIDSLKSFVLALHEHVKNLKADVTKELADDEYVMSWVHFSGTGDGQAGTTQGDFDVRGVQITKFKNGKATEHWEAMDMRDVAKMVQRIAPPQNDSLVDSTNVH